MASPPNASFSLPPVNLAIAQGLESLEREARLAGQTRKAAAYQRAIRSVRTCREPITSGEYAKMLNGIGPYLADQIDILINQFRQSGTTSPPAASKAPHINFSSISVPHPIHPFLYHIPSPTPLPSYHISPPFLMHQSQDTSLMDDEPNDIEISDEEVEEPPASVREWLRQFNYEHYIDKFLQAGYDNMLVLKELNADDLQHIGIDLPGHRKTLLLAAQVLKRQCEAFDRRKKLRISRTSRKHTQPPVASDSVLLSASAAATTVSATLPSTSPSPATAFNHSLVSMLPKVQHSDRNAPLPTVTFEFIQLNADEQAIRDGARLFREKRVGDLIVDGDSITVEMRPSLSRQRVTPSGMGQRVHLTCASVNFMYKVSKASCTCRVAPTSSLFTESSSEKPSRKGWCKHIAAVLLAIYAINNADVFGSSNDSSHPADSLHDLLFGLPELPAAETSTMSTSQSARTKRGRSTNRSAPHDVVSVDELMPPTPTKRPRVSVGVDIAEPAPMPATPAAVDSAAAAHAPSKKGKKPARYIPRYRSGAWALLVALREAETDESYLGSLSKRQLIDKARPHCDTPFDNMGALYTAWSGMHTLIKHRLVKKLAKGRYELTEEGRTLAKALLAQGGSGRVDKGEVVTEGGVAGESDVEAEIAIENATPVVSSAKPPSSQPLSPLRPTADEGTPDIDSQIMQQAETIGVDTDAISLASTASMDIDTQFDTVPAEAVNANSMDVDMSTYEVPPPPAPTLLPGGARSSPILVSDHNDTHELSILSTAIAPASTTTAPTSMIATLTTAATPPIDTPPTATSPTAATTTAVPTVIGLEICILVDHRELNNSSSKAQCDLRKGLAHADVFSEARKLPVGDMVWIAKVKLASQTQNTVIDERILPDAIVERKTNEDLLASIVDGRFEEQKARLKRAGMQNVIYVIEGPPPKRTDELNEKIMRMQVEDGFHVQDSINMLATVRFLRRATLHLEQKYRQAMNENSRWWESLRKYDEFASSVGKSSSLTLRDVFAKQLVALGGVQAAKAAAIVSHYATPHQLIAEYERMESEGCDLKDLEDRLKNLVVESTTTGDDTATQKKQRVGAALSKRLYHYYRDGV